MQNALCAMENADLIPTRLAEAYGLVVAAQSHPARYDRALHGPLTPYFKGAIPESSSVAHTLYTAWYPMLYQAENALCQERWTDPCQNPFQIRAWVTIVDTTYSALPHTPHSQRHPTDELQSIANLQQTKPRYQRDLPRRDLRTFL